MRIMNKRDKIVILGGDLRQYTAAVMLEQMGYSVKMFAIYGAKESADAPTFGSDFEMALCEADAVILPLPVSADGVYLNCPCLNGKEKLKLTDVLKCIGKNAVIVGGKIPPAFTAEAEKGGFAVRDYFEFEEFQIQNAYITAEAALSIAMNSLDKNVFGSKIAITGYGRIAKHLERLLLGLGADITVAARKDSDLAWAYSHGCSVLKLGEGKEENIYELSDGYDVIYNTVPQKLFDEEFLKRVNKSTYIIDLSSLPGGVDIRAAKELGSNVLWAASLPGKYAPKSAGIIIASCVKGILTGEGVSP